MLAGTRFSQWTPTDHSAWLWIASILSMVYAMLVLGIRALVKWNMQGWDDLALGIAYVVAIAQWATMFSALDHGLAKAASLVSVQSMVLTSRLVFASRLLFLITISLSKCSILLFLRQLFTDKSTRVWRLCTGLTALVIAWTLASTLIIGLNCSPDDSTDALKVKQCTHNGMRVKALVGVEFVLEVAVAGMPAYFFTTVHMSTRNKVIVTSAFAFRLIDAALFIAYLESFLDFINGNSNVGISGNLSWQQILLCWSLISATIPCLKGFLGRFRTDDLLTLVEGSHYGRTPNGSNSGSYALNSLKSSAARQSMRDGTRHSKRNSQLRLQNHDLEISAHAFAHRGTVDDLSISSDASEQMIIRRKVEVNVVHESRPVPLTIE